MASERYERGLAIRKAVLGEEYVEKALDNTDDFNRDFQEMVTEYCWGGVWGREGLSRKQRSINNLCMLAALNRPQEFELHFRGALRNGCTLEELREVLLQIAVYCGVPAAVDGFRHRPPGARRDEGGAPPHERAGARLRRPRPDGRADGRQSGRGRPCAGGLRHRGARGPRCRTARAWRSPRPISRVGRRRCFSACRTPPQWPRSRPRSRRRPERVAGVVVDLSTIGIAAAEAAAEALAAAGIAYIDAPVSGGVAGARAGTISVMAACSDAEFAAIRPLLAGFAENPVPRRHPARPGPGHEAAPTTSSRPPPWSRPRRRSTSAVPTASISLPCSTCSTSRPGATPRPARSSQRAS